jgi:ATP-dependent DNA helicase
MAAARGKTSKAETMVEMAAQLLRLEGEKIQVVSDTTEGRRSVISDEDLDALLDRRPEVFSDRGKGWTSATGKPAEGEKGDNKAAFAVYDAPADEGNDALSQMLEKGMKNEMGAEESDEE